MDTFKDIANEWDKIKDTPEEIDSNRVKDNKAAGSVAADDMTGREKHLPTRKQHENLSERLSNMFDKSKRSGSYSKGGGLILPNGRQNFADFHDNYTGTGRMAKKTEVKPLEIAENAPKVDTPQVSAVLYKRCIDCGGPVDKTNFVHDMDFVPPINRFPGEVEMWAAVGLKPGMIVGSLFCLPCVSTFGKEHKRILNDPFKNALQVIGPGGVPVTVASMEAEQLKHKHREKTRLNIIQMLKVERENPDSDAFYGAAKHV